MNNLSRTHIFGLFIAGLLVTAALPILGDSTTPVVEYSVNAQSYPVQKVLVRVVTQYPSDENEVELKLLEKLGDKNVDGGSYTELFSSASTPSQIIQTLKQKNYNTYLCVWPRTVVRWDPSTTNPPPTITLKSFLGQKLAYKPSQDTTRRNLTAKWIDPSFDEELPGSDPIAGDSGGDTWTVTKFNAAVFDVASGKRIWRGIIKVQSSPDLRTSWYDKELLTKVMGYMAGAGLIPA